jgi:hypothetical protein
MNDQEIRAKALEVAALIIGQDKDLASFDMDGRFYEEFPKYNKLRKYEFLAALIEQDILKGFPIQEKIKYLFETKDSQIDNAGLIALRKRFEP